MLGVLSGESQAGRSWVVSTPVMRLPGMQSRKLPSYSLHDPGRMKRKHALPAVSTGVQCARLRTLRFRHTAFLLTCLFLCGCVSGQNGTANDPSDLDLRLRDLAFSRLDRSRPLTPAARQALLDFVDHGARRLMDDGATPERVDQAEINLGRFMAVLNEESNRMTLHEIGLDTLSSSRRELCPLYPFC